ncbi:MAG: hypothetical protein KGL39_60480 [Patescibacteria group bacterium]|nr:hypothetical protein [Patescibacteria group bacterium]
MTTAIAIGRLSAKGRAGIARGWLILFFQLCDNPGQFFRGDVDRNANAVDGFRWPAPFFGWTDT